MLFVYPYNVSLPGFILFLCLPPCSFFYITFTTSSSVGLFYQSIVAVVLRLSLTFQEHVSNWTETSTTTFVFKPLSRSFIFSCMSQLKKEILLGLNRNGNERVWERKLVWEKKLKFKIWEKGKWSEKVKVWRINWRRKRKSKQLLWRESEKGSFKIKHEQLW